MRRTPPVSGRPEAMQPEDSVGVLGLFLFPFSTGFVPFDRRSDEDESVGRSDRTRGVRVTALPARNDGDDGGGVMSKFKLEYVWLDGYHPVPTLRSKTQVKEFDS